MVVLNLAVVTALAALSSAAPFTIKHVVHEERVKPPSEWIKTSRIESSAILPIRIGLTQSNLHKGPEYLAQVSDPSSDKYGKHWTAEEVHDMFAPPEEHVNAIKEWLSLSGIHDSRVVHSDNKGWLAFDATTEEAESLFLAEYFEHEHVSSDKMRVGCDKYHVPDHLAGHIDYITPGIKLTPVVKRSVKSKRTTQVQAARHSHKAEMKFEMPHGWKPSKDLPPDLQACGYNITTPCIKALYSIPEAPQHPHSGNALGLYEQGDYFAKEDLDLYWKNINPAVPVGTYPTPNLIDGANYSVPAYSPWNGGESDIDIEMSFGLIYPQEVILYQVDDQVYEPEEVATTNLFNTFLDALDGSYCTYEAYGETGDDPSIDPVYPDPAPGGYKGTLQCGVYKPTNVISASYGQAEADLPMKYTERQCNEFLKLGLQGHSILFASGDYGVSSFPNDFNTINGCLGPEGKIFNPQYPSNCPYVTSVGGSMLYNDQTVQNAESVMQVDLGGSAVNFSSAGGFSNYFARPWYQELAVEHYFEVAKPEYPYYSEINVDVNTTKGVYNRIGRAFPDVAANGAYFPAYNDGALYHFFGSSLASPLFASVLTLINEERLSIGKGPVGFINPVLYANPWVLNDITNGTNLGCGTEGFHATEGWDPATGLGTPNYPKMLELFLLLP